ncbi:hypothetical protein ACQT3V_13105 [Brucella sp. NF 2653]|uniref:hypothetical protein n=1 Tax=Brucella sp. NF 2653 TaxID=693748 RepID=UPI003D10A72F
MEQNQTAQPELTGEHLLEKGNKWLERIKASESREDDWRKDAEAAEKTYACDTKARHGKLYDFNILHSNVETIVPAIYNSTPVPDVRRRFTLAIGEPPQPPQQQPVRAASLRSQTRRRWSYSRRKCRSGRRSLLLIRPQKTLGP